jgi:hypothetical protein
MHEIALYHPRIHFPSDAWVKTAALYWTKIARIVPGEYQPQDSRTVKELSDEIGFVVNVTPEPQKRHITHPVFDSLRVFIEHNREAMFSRYGISEEDHPAKWRLRDARDISEAHTDLSIIPYVGIISMAKGWHGVDLYYAVLHSNGLAVMESDYILMHPALARVCMSILAEDIARRDRLQPITDDGDAYSMTTGWTESRMYSVLLPDLPNRAEQQEGEAAGRARPLPVPIGLIAVQAVTPRDIDRIPVGKIIELREQYATYFSSFRDATDAVAAEITAQLTDVEDVNVVRAYIEQEVQERLIVPSRQLRRELRQMKVDTVTATLTSKYEIPALAGLVSAGMLAHQPLIAGGSAAAIALLGHLRGIRAQLQEKLAESPVSYLMLVEDSLAARTGLERTVRQIRKITGVP